VDAHHVVGAIGVDEAGDKHLLGLAAGSSENTPVVKDLLGSLVERGLDPRLAYLFVIDGSKALRSAIVSRMTTLRTARAWHYKEQLREILERKQVHVARAMLLHWCTCVMRSKVEPMKDVASMVRRHIDGIIAWAQTRMTNGFLEALNGLFQAAKRRARGYTRFATIKTVIFLIAGKLDFRVVNPHAAQPT
jgi:hypothetical protein